MGSSNFSSQLAKPWKETPLIESSTLSKAAGCRVFLKLENLQPASSFKSRGIGNLMLSLIHTHEASDERHKPLHFFSSSGGNAGLACVTASTQLGHLSTVVLPTSTEESMVARLKAAGASEVISHGSSWMYADEYLRGTIIPRAEAQGEVGVYVPPFDHPKIWEGNSTLVHELRDQMPDNQRPDVIVCSVGGGGLFSGIMQGIEEVGWNNPSSFSSADTSPPPPIHVLAVETLGADSLARSLSQNVHVSLPAITSIASSLGALRVAERAFELARRYSSPLSTTSSSPSSSPSATSSASSTSLPSDRPDRPTSSRPTASSPVVVSSIVLEDAEACMACWRFADDERILVEPACGASVALVYDGRLRKHLLSTTICAGTAEARDERRRPFEDLCVVIVVCGGSRISLDMLSGFKARYGTRTAEVAANLKQEQRLENDDDDRRKVHVGEETGEQDAVPSTFTS